MANSRFSLKNLATLQSNLKMVNKDIPVFKASFKDDTKAAANSSYYGTNESYVQIVGELVGIVFKLVSRSYARGRCRGTDPYFDLSLFIRKRCWGEAF